MYINKPSVTKIEAADRVNLLHSTSCKFTLYFIIPRTGCSTQLTENRTTLDLSFLISPDVSTNSIVKVSLNREGIDSCRTVVWFF